MSMRKRVNALRARMTPRPKLTRSLYHVVLDTDGQPLPGYEQVEQRAARTGMNVKEYIGFNPDEDGIEE